MGDESLEECACIIFHNCSDMEDSVNSLTVALTNFSLSRVILALFSALKVNTGSGKRMLKSFNLATCQPNSIRKSSNDIPGSLRKFSNISYAQKADWFISSRKSVSSFSYNFFIPSSKLRTAVSNSKTVSLAFPSNDKNSMRAHFVLSSEVISSYIFISFFHVLYLSLSNVGGAKCFGAIVSFSSATIVKYKEFRVQHSAYGDAFLHPSFSHSHINQYGHLFTTGP